MGASSDGALPTHCGRRSSAAARWAAGCSRWTGRRPRSGLPRLAAGAAAARSPRCWRRARRSSSSGGRTTAPSTTTPTSPRWAASTPATWAGPAGRCGPRPGRCCRTCSTAWSTPTRRSAAADYLFMLERFGFLEETYFDISYDPIRLADGSVGGVFCIVTETTGRVLDERRVRTLSALGSRLADQADQAGLGAPGGRRCSARTPRDVPFAALYLDDPDGGGELTLAGSAGARPAAGAGPRAASTVAGGAADRAPGPAAGGRVCEPAPLRPPGRRWCCRWASAPPTPARWWSGSAGTCRWTGTTATSWSWRPRRSPGRWPICGRTSRSAAGPRNWPRWTPPRPTSSRTSATSSVPR